MRHVSAAEAKTGDHVDSYENQEQFTDAAERMETALRDNHGRIRRELVYCTFPLPGKNKIMWHIYLLKEK